MPSQRYLSRYDEGSAIRDGRVAGSAGSRARRIIWECLVSLVGNRGSRLRGSKQTKLSNLRMLDCRTTRSHVLQSNSRVR